MKRGEGTEDPITPLFVGLINLLQIDRRLLVRRSSTDSMLHIPSSCVCRNALVWCISIELNCNWTTSVLHISGLLQSDHCRVGPVELTSVI